VSQTIAKVIRISPGEDLGLIVQTAKRSGMNDSVAITLKVIAIGVRRLGKTPATGVFYTHRIGCEHGRSIAAALSTWHLASTALG
jgi:hypothetical protein